MNRAASTLGPPDPNRDYSLFPEHKIRARLRWYRVFEDKLGRSPWYFSAKEGRFNLSSPKGTLNVAHSHETALREYLGPVLLKSVDIPETAVTMRKISCLEIPEVRVADLTNGDASRFGIASGDISGAADEEYKITREWAETFYEAGKEGILSRSRFGFGVDPLCLYIFGEEGEHPLGDILDWECKSAAAVLKTLTGYRLVPVPHSDTLMIED